MIEIPGWYLLGFDNIGTINEQLLSYTTSLSFDQGYVAKNNNTLDPYSTPAPGYFQDGFQTLAKWLPWSDLSPQ